MSNEQDFKIKTEVFEGPLDLLLSLIEKRKLLINDISLAEVTDEFIIHVKELEHLPLNKTTNFILIASTLLLIKSKSLLPTIDLSSEEQESMEDLEIRLKLYKRFKELSVHVENKFGKEILFPRLEKKIVVETFAPSKQINLQNLYASAISAIKALPKKEIVPKAVLKKVISLEEMITKLTKRIQSGINMKFSEFASTNKDPKLSVGREERVNIIVGFLAMLELVKEGILKANQENHYSEIDMETKEVTTPSY